MFCVCKKEVFNTVGLMDETYFVYVDDLDFMYRLRKLNYSIWYENSLSIDHKISQSTGGKFSAFSVFYGKKQNLFCKKVLYFTQ
jgi:GT2 family glycosyltransferase